MKTGIQLADDEILVLRDVKADMTSHGGFTWPESGDVEALDWQDTDKCGQGLHGLPWGVGGEYRIGGDDAKYLLVAVSTAQGNYQHGTGEMRDKCKFWRGRVVFCGKLQDATALLQRYAPPNTPINWSTQTAGDLSTQTAGDLSTQTAEDRSTQTAGYQSRQTAEERSTQTAGYQSTQTAGYESTQTAGDRSTQTAGDGSTQTAGHESIQTAGYRSTQTAGDRSTQRAGLKSVQIIRYWANGVDNVKCRIITENTANKWFRFEKDDWRLCTDEEIAEAEAKLKKEAADAVSEV